MADRSVVVRLRAEVEGFRKGMSDAADSADKAQKRFEAVGNAGKVMAGVGLAMAAGIGVAVKAYADFDKQMSKVQAATHASSDVMQQFRDASIQAGADTAFSAKEAGQAIEELAKAGVSSGDILGGGLNGALSLAAAGELEVGKAAEIAATALTQFKLEGKDIPHVADLLAAGAGKAQGSVEDLGMALNQSGLVASQYGLSIEETTGGLAAFASAGLIGSDAGTSFKTMLQRLTPTSKEAADKMNELGFSAFDADGNIKSLDAIAGNLQASMKGLTSEQRNAAMATIFGSDAVRAANVLYEQGAQGVKDWTDKVNDAGYAAQTAAINQDNLAGDIEKLGGSIDSVFLKSASGMNEALRGIVKNIEGVVGWIGEIPAPMLNAAVGIGGVVAAVGLLGGGLLTVIPKIAAAKSSWDTFSISNEKLAGRMTKSAKVAGVLAAAVAGLQVVGAVQKSFGPAPKTMEEFAQATLKSGNRVEQLDKIVKDSSISGEVKNIGQAMLRMNDNMVLDNLDRFGADVFGLNTMAGRLRDNVSGIDKQLSILATGGGSAAVDLFKEIADATNQEAAAQGKASLSTEQLLKVMPQYADELRKQATAVGVQLTEQELANLALGEVPDRMKTAMNTTQGKAAMDEYAAEAAKANAEALLDMGLNIDGTIASLSKLVELMFKSANTTLDARAAESAYQETLDGLKKKIDEVNASQTAGNSVLNKAKTSFDLTSDAGRKANDVFGDLASKAQDATIAMANNGGSQTQLQAKLKDSYTQLYNTARGFGVSKEGADNLARSALGIPKNVKIETAIANYAQTLAQAQGVKFAVDNIPRRKDVTVFFQTDASGFYDPSIGTTGKGKVGKFEQGGRIPQYLATGGIAGLRNGTDTQPIMATPGEFMIKRASARAIGYENLAYANANGRWPGSSAGGGDTNVTVMIGDEAIDPRMVRIVNHTLNQRSAGAARQRGGRG
uniref:phage tail tape measure protein n=1 Tax=Arthrobacter silvisoli TaxID=2291022 RepID=UPI003F4925B4